MGYVKYSEQYKAYVIDGYKEHAVGVYAYARMVGLTPRTLYIWLDNAGVLRGDVRLRKTININCFSLVQKLDAINMRLCGKEQQEIADVIGCTKMTVLNWYYIYNQKGVYYLMSKKDNNKKTLKIIEQRKYIKELEEKLHNLQMEIDAYKVVNDILGKSHGLSLTPRLTMLENIIKASAIQELRPKYKKCELTKLFDISASTLDGNIKALDAPDKYCEIREVIRKIFLESKERYGYRRIWAVLVQMGYRIADKVVRRLMKEMGLLVRTKKMRKYNSYKNDGNLPTKNWLRDSGTGKHFFRPSQPFEILGTDVTEFHLNGYKVYLSLVVDFYDQMIVSWSISRHPDMNLVLKSLDRTIKVAGDHRYILHSDQGSCYRSPKWKEICQNNHILQSMSRKGKSCDNAPVEAVNGKIKTEFFYGRDFNNISAKSFMKKLDEYIKWYNNERVFIKLGGLSPAKYRLLNGYKQVA